MPMHARVVLLVLVAAGGASACAVSAAAGPRASGRRPRSAPRRPHTSTSAPSGVPGRPAAIAPSCASRRTLPLAAPPWNVRGAWRSHGHGVPLGDIWRAADDRLSSLCIVRRFMQGRLAVQHRHASVGGGPYRRHPRWGLTVPLDPAQRAGVVGCRPEQRVFLFSGSLGGMVPPSKRTRQASRTACSRCPIWSRC